MLSDHQMGLIAAAVVMLIMLTYFVVGFTFGPGGVLIFHGAVLTAVASAVAYVMFAGR